MYIQWRDKNNDHTQKNTSNENDLKKERLLEKCLKTLWKSVNGPETPCSNSWADKVDKVGISESTRFNDLYWPVKAKKSN